MALETLDSCILCGGSRLEWIDRENRFCRCGECGLVFDNPRPDPESIVAFYSKPVQYDGWLKVSRARELLWKRRLAKMGRRLREGALLDIGTGIGQFLHHARGRFKEVTGTEVSASGIAIAKEKYGLEVLQGDALAIDFGERRFDTITIFHVLEHVGNPGHLIEKCKGLLNHGGVLFIAVPNDIASVGAWKRKLVARLGAGRVPRSRNVGLPRIEVDDPRLEEIHLSHFTPGVLARRLERTGFEVLDSSLDPFYAESGPRLFAHTAVYLAFSLVRALTGLNLYGTIWICARKA